MPSLFGLDTLSVRNLAAYVATDRWELADGLIRYSFAGAFLVATVAAAVAAGVAILVLAPGDARLGALLLAMLVVPLMVLTRLVEATLRGFHHLVIGQLPETRSSP